MDAQRLTIVEKLRNNPIFRSVSLADFQYQEAENVDPRIVVEQPTISLYCVDHDTRRAIFVVTPQDLDLSRVPFYYQAQYEAAQSLIAVSYDALHTLAEQVTIDPSRIILVYSTGRCGSTLVSHALNQADGVYSFSEPDVFTQLVVLRDFDSNNDLFISALVEDCTKVMCAAAQHGGASAWALKFRGFCIELGHLFYRSFPAAKVVFLYRSNTEGYVNSFVRVLDLFEPERLQALPAFQQGANHLSPLVRVYSATHTRTISPIELFVLPWVSVIQRCLDLQQQGVPMICARYEDLKRAPQKVLDAVFTFCDLSVSDPAAIDQVLAKDSQAGTELSQERAQHSRSMLTVEHIEEIHRLLNEYAPTLPSDVILPHTYRPS